VTAVPGSLQRERREVPDRLHAGHARGDPHREECRRLGQADAVGLGADRERRQQQGGGDQELRVEVGELGHASSMPTRLPGAPS
jgi:hypothetical protein